MSEYAVVPTANLVPKPEGLPLNSAAVPGCAWLTAYRMLFTMSGLERGEPMLVLGSSGGVATALIQMGSAAGGGRVGDGANGGDLGARETVGGRPCHQSL